MGHIPTILRLDGMCPIVINETYYLAMKAPPLLVSYSSLEDYLAALGPMLRDQHEVEIRQLVDQGLPPIVSSRCLAVLFGFTTNFVNAMRIENWKYYRRFSIKSGKKTRHIHAPKVALKVIQKWFGSHLAATLQFDDYVYGFVKGRSAIGAAAFHRNARWVYSIDIQDFFSSTPAALMKNSLQEIGYSQKACDIIVPLCCFRENLAQGAPSSPVLSNLVMREIDSQLFKISQAHDVRFTRYADDMVFSGKDEFPTALKDETKSVFDNTVWILSKEKEYFAELPNRLKVHGLLVHGSRPRLTKGYRNRIRAFKHVLESGKAKNRDIKRLSGHIKYAKSVDDY